MTGAMSDADREWFLKSEQKARFYAVFNLIQEMGNQADVEEAKDALLPIAKRVMGRL